MANFVGRDRELNILREVLERALQGEGSLVLVSGEAGIGKSSLVERLTSVARDQGCLILSGYCYDLSVTPPYGPWLELTDRYESSGDLPELPEVLKRGTGIGDLTSQVDLFNVARDFFRCIAMSQPLVIVLEDLHWSDQASLDLLRYLARHLDGQRVLVAATFRDDEITRQHPLFALLPSVVRESRVTRVELGTLGRDDVRALLTARWQLAAEDTEPLVDYLLGHAEGNPFFTEELLRTLEQNEHVRVESGKVTLANLHQVPVPTLIRQVIEARVAQLDGESRHFLEVAAAIGHRVPLDVWQKAAGLSDDEMLAVLDQAFALHLLEETGSDDTVSFVHALTREALYTDILPPRRRIWHRIIAETLAQTPNPVTDSVAHHFEQANDMRAVDWLIRAGESAERNFAWRNAVDRFHAVCQILESDPNRTRERGWFAYRTAKLGLYIDPARGIADLDLALHVADEVGDEVLRAASLVRRGHLRCFRGDVRRGGAEMFQGVEAWDRLSIEQKRECPYWDIVGSDLHLNVFRGTLLLMLAGVGHFQETLEIAKSFLPEMESARDRLLSARHIYWLDGYVGIGYAQSALGRHERARELFDFARHGYNAIGIPAMESYSSMATLRHVLAPYQTERVAERRRVAQEMDDAWNRAAGAIRPEMSSRLQRILMLALEGSWSQVKDIASRGMDWHANSQRRLELLAAMGPVARNQGNPDLAWQQVRTALPDGPATEPGNTYYLETRELIELAVLLSLDDERLDDARRWLETHDRWMAWSDALRGQAEGKLLWARYYLEAGESEEARRVAEESLDLASDPRQPLAVISALRFLGEIDAALGNHEQADGHLVESASLAEACEVPLEIALSKVALAELRSVTGRHEEALTLVGEARAICESLEAKPTLYRIDKILAAFRPRAVEPSYGLTPREKEVLDLLARGMSDKGIADELYISHHTVMRHVSSILRKLDVESRTAAVALVSRHQGLSVD